MRLLHDLPLADLTPGRLWPRPGPPRPVRWPPGPLFDGDRSTRDQANHAIALALRFRDAGVRKLSVDRRVDYLARVVRPDEALASSLLMALHLVCRQALLVSFLDELQIPNHDGLISEDYELGPVGAEVLEPAVVRLREHHDLAEVEVYLASLLALDPDIWGGLGQFLQADRASAPSDGGNDGDGGDDGGGGKYGREDPSVG